MQSAELAATSTTHSHSSLPKRAALGLTIAFLANALIRVVAGVFVDVSGVEPLMWQPILGATVVATVGATVVYAAVSRISDRANYHFTVVAAVVLILSMVPVFTVAPTVPGITTPALVVLAVLHVTTAVPIVASLTGVLRR